MAVPQLKESFTAQDYFAWEQDQVDRYEYCDGEIFNMAGASRAHNRISVNATVVLENELDGTSCDLYASDMRVELVKDAHYVYPDLFVTCDAEDHDGEDEYTKKYPRLIVEILSKSTRQYDTGTKLKLYLQMPSLEQILLIDPDTQSAALHTRSPNRMWSEKHIGLQDTIEFTLGFSVPLTRFFKRLI